MAEPVTDFTPGPTHVPRDALEAMTAPMIGHRSEEFRRLHEAVTTRLGPVFRTSQPVLVVPASATLAMEMAIASLVPHRVLHLVGGAFSERWLEISRSRGVEADALEVGWGEAANPEALREALGRADYDAVAVTHSETSTGVINPLGEMARIVGDESDALVLADCVSSVAGAPMEFDDWGIDFALTGTQKALATPPGLALVAASPRAMERAVSTPDRGYYTDLLRHRDLHERGFTLTTPSIPVMRALLVQLDRIASEGIEARWKRHEALRDATDTWAGPAGFTYASAPGAGSPTVACLRPPAGLAPGDLLTALAERGLTVGAGYGPWRSETIRIGHMGEVRLADLERLLTAVDEVAA